MDVYRIHRYELIFIFRMCSVLFSTHIHDFGKKLTQMLQALHVFWTQIIPHAEN